MVDENNVVVKMSYITWALWAVAALLLFGGTVHALSLPGPAPLFGPVVWWGLYVLTATAVWTVNRSIHIATRKVLARISQQDSTWLNGHTEQQLHSLR